MGEKLPRHTEIIVDFITPMMLMEISILNPNNNVQTISVRYFDKNDKAIFRNGRILVQKNQPNARPIIDQDLPNQFVSKVIINIEELKDNRHDAFVILTIKGCGSQST